MRGNCVSTKDTGTSVGDKNPVLPGFNFVFKILSSFTVSALAH